jgi:hypothetical protein
MLIFTDEQLRAAGIKSLSKRCSYCSKALAAYPLVLSDDAGLAVFHAACAAALATEIIVDLYTFFRPPAPYQHLFVCDFSRTLAASAKLCDFAPSRPNPTYQVWRLGPGSQIDPFIC